ncbi:2-dehydropantoate 2-reductase [Bacillus sp. FJAT-45350]|uniref:2-dehydropantoate 2-reductase n=1 Tax=Bacillus sp. FJAT-45350 TaxID=2011014 RepID=UPI0015C80E02|nr:2-dehydropantoate 2-reductase [Bacillus sp. FJAT-45350]
MKVAVIGAGAVGMLVAAYLKKEALDVTILTRGEKLSRELTEKGVTLTVGDISSTVEMKAEKFVAKDIHTYDLIFLAVKQYHLPELMSELNVLEESKLPAFVFLQNGMGHLTLLKEFKGLTSYIGIVEHGVLKRSPYEVVHTGIGQIKFGVYSGQVDVLEKLTALIHNVNFKMEIASEWLDIMTRKLVVNACINPLTALFRVENGKLRENPYFLKLMRYLFDEATETLEYMEKDLLWEEVLRICLATGKNRSSMLRDIESYNPTEIEAISGYVLANRKIDLPYTTFVYESIKGIEREGEGVCE